MPIAHGQPVPGRCIGCLFSAQGEYGTAVTPANPVGIAEFEVTDDSGNTVFNSIGSYSPIYIKEGMSQVNWSVSVRALQTKALLAQAVRVNGALPWLTLGFGYQLDSGQQWAWQVQDCKIGSARIRHTAPGPVELEVSGIGGLITVLGAFVPQNIGTAEPWMNYEVSLLFAGGSGRSQALSVDIDHNLGAQAVLRGEPLSGPHLAGPRLWDYLTEGHEAISGEFTRFSASGVNLQAAVQNPVTVVYNLTSLRDPSDTMTLALAGVKIPRETFAGRLEDNAQFTVPFEALAWSLT